MVDAAAAELLQVGNVKVQVDELRPLERRVRIKSVDIDAAHVVAVRNAAGRVNLLLAAEAPSGAASAVARLPLPTSAASVARRSAAAASARCARRARRRRPGRRASPRSRSAPPASTGATRPPRPPPQLALTDFSLAAQAIAWPLDAPVVFSGEGQRRQLPPSTASCRSPGRAHGSAATVKVTLDDLPLAPLRPYLNAASSCRRSPVS